MFAQTGATLMELRSLKFGITAAMAALNFVESCLILYHSLRVTPQAFRFIRIEIKGMKFEVNVRRVKVISRHSARVENVESVFAVSLPNRFLIRRRCQKDGVMLSILYANKFSMNRILNSKIILQQQSDIVTQLQCRSISRSFSS